MGNPDIPVNEFISETAIKLGMRIQDIKDTINAYAIVMPEGTSKEIFRKQIIGAKKQKTKQKTLPKKLQRGWI